MTDTPRMIDSSVLETIAALDPNDSSGLVRRIVGMYEEDSVRQLAELEAALSGGDLDGARRAVHTLKSASSHVGINALAELCLEAEVAARAGKLDDVKSLWPRIRELHAAALRELADMKFGEAA